MLVFSICVLLLSEEEEKKKKMWKAKRRTHKKEVQKLRKVCVMKDFMAKGKTWLST